MASVTWMLISSSPGTIPPPPIARSANANTESSSEELCDALRLLCAPCVEVFRVLHWHYGAVTLSQVSTLASAS
jgi:hypothetical protein